MSKSLRDPPWVVTGGSVGLCLLLLVSVRTTTASDLVAADVLALDGDAGYGEYLAGECSTCHTASADAGIPVIRGQSRDALVQALIEYREGVRENDTMRSVAGAMGADEMAALVAYFSSQ